MLLLYRHTLYICCDCFACSAEMLFINSSSVTVFAPFFVVILKHFRINSQFGYVASYIECSINWPYIASYIECSINWPYVASQLAS